MRVAMALVALGALTACSFHGTRRPQFSSETNRIECTNDIGVPIFDATIGLTAAGVAAFLYKSNDEDQESRDAAKQIAAPILLLSALGFVSAIYGFKKVSQCNEVKALEREEIRAAVAQRKHRKQAWGRAWAATQQAAAAARTGDCAMVVKLEVFVRELDGEFHDIVFARDAAIARCFAPPGATPTETPPPATTPPIDLRPKLPDKDAPTEKRPPGEP